jgi:hypothetical protein
MTLMRTPRPRTLVASVVALLFCPALAEEPLPSPNSPKAAPPPVADPAAPDAEGFVSLFNGKDLDGWVQRGGKAKFRVEKGMIIGTTVPNSQNSFLCTKKDYADFVLELEFKIHPKANSGIQIRSQVFDEEKKLTVDGKEIKIPPGRVHGYQVEIDPSPDRAWTGGIYDEGRRGWLQDLKEKPVARQAFKQSEWNAFRIECKGDSIKTWLNGVPVADLKDGMTPSGFIALQVHGVGKDETEPMEVAFRKIRIKPSPP